MNQHRCVGVGFAALLAVVAGVAGSVRSSAQSAAAVPQSDSAVYTDFFTAVLGLDQVRRSDFSMRPDATQLIVRETTTALGSRSFCIPQVPTRADTAADCATRLASRLADTPLALVETFVRANLETGPISRSFVAPLPILFMTDEQIRAISESRPGWFWQEFYRRYPGAQGVFTLSHAGFSQDGQHALLYAGNTSDGLAGAGYVVRLALQNGKWVIVAKTVIWVS